jgi:hypothetical protein
VNANVEGPKEPSKVRQVCEESRGWLGGVFTQLAREAGADDAELVGRRLALLYDGAVVGASMSDEPGTVAVDARAMAKDLLDAHTAPSKKRGKTHAEDTSRARRAGRS